MYHNHIVFNSLHNWSEQIVCTALRHCRRNKIAINIINGIKSLLFSQLDDHVVLLELPLQDKDQPGKGHGAGQGQEQQVRLGKLTK